MRTISALDVRARFGQVLDEAAAGERFIVERAGMPVAAIVPLRDLEALDPERIRERRLAAVDQLVRMRAVGPGANADHARRSSAGSAQIGTGTGEREHRSGTGGGGRVSDRGSCAGRPP